MEVSYVSLKFPQFNHLCSVKNLQKKFMIKLLLANFQKHAWMTDKTIILLASTPKIGIFVTIFNGFYPLTILAKPSPREKCFSWSVFSYIRTECEGDLPIQSKCRKIRARKNSVFGHFLRSVSILDVCENPGYAPVLAIANFWYGCFWYSNFSSSFGCSCEFGSSTS